MYKAHSQPVIMQHHHLMASESLDSDMTTNWLLQISYTWCLFAIIWLAFSHHLSELWFDKSWPCVLLFNWHLTVLGDTYNIVLNDIMVPSEHFPMTFCLFANYRLLKWHKGHLTQLRDCEMPSGLSKFGMKEGYSLWSLINIYNGISVLQDTAGLEECGSTDWV